MTKEKKEKIRFVLITSKYEYHGRIQINKGCNHQVR